MQIEEQDFTIKIEVDPKDLEFSSGPLEPDSSAPKFDDIVSSPPLSPTYDNISVQDIDMRPTTCDTVQPDCVG